MANNPIVVVHGWSDTSASFERLARELAVRTGRSINHIWLGDYVSLDDDVTLADLAQGLQQGWLAAGLPRVPARADVVVHSTGGLVIRQWMHTYYARLGTAPPVRNLVMLAPANFGSPLAHKGRALVGRAFKGFKSGFETGTQILKALEMASPYSWSLAHKDRFDANVFGVGGVRCTVIVGNSGYQGIQGLVNHNGSDGTVYVATASLECARITMHVQRSSGPRALQTMDKIVISKPEVSRGKTAFLVLNNYDHSSITAQSGRVDGLLDSLVHALQVTRQRFPGWIRTCDEKTAQVTNRYSTKRDASKHAFQNTVFRVVDDHGSPIEDYALEFYGQFTDGKDRWAREFHHKVLGKVHAYSDNKAFRSLMIDVTELERIEKRVRTPLCFSLSAVPDVKLDSAVVGYKTMGENDIDKVTLPHDQLQNYFAPNRTMLIDVVVPRYQKDKLARFKRAPSDHS